jgi:hypothetical protein
VLSIEYFLLSLFCMVDDFCRSRPDFVARCSGSRGPQPKLSPSEVITLNVFGQWNRFDGERDFWRFAQSQLRCAFPQLCDRSQFNRASRRLTPVTAAFFQHLAEVLGSRECLYEVIDRFGVATRRSGRRGIGWLPEYTDKGLCSRIGFFHGVQVLSCVTRTGIITGFGVAAGSTKDQPMAGELFRYRKQPHWSMPWIGRPAASQVYLSDKGFSGPKRHVEWFLETEAVLTCAPQKGHGTPWPQLHERAIASMRQIVETVHEKLLRKFRLQNERPHDITGLFSKLCAKSALHNACIWMNRQLGRADLAFTELLGW